MECNWEDRHLARASRRNWVVKRLWQFQEEWMVTGHWQVFGTTVALLGSPPSEGVCSWMPVSAVRRILSQLTRTQRAWKEKDKESQRKTGTIKSIRTSIYILHTFLLDIIYRNSLPYSKFQHRLLHTGKGLLSWFVLIFLLFFLNWWQYVLLMPKNY